MLVPCIWVNIESVELSAQNSHHEKGSLVEFLYTVKLEKRLEINLTDGNWLKWLNTESSIPLYRAALNVKSDIWPMRSGKKRNAFLLTVIHIYNIFKVLLNWDVNPGYLLGKSNFILYHLNLAKYACREFWVLKAIILLLFVLNILYFSSNMKNTSLVKST